MCWVHYLIILGISPHYIGYITSIILGTLPLLSFHHCSFQYDSDVTQVLLFYGDYLSVGNCYEFAYYLDELDVQYL